MRIMKRMFAIMMAVIMCITMLPVLGKTVQAENTDAWRYTINYSQDEETEDTVSIQEYLLDDPEVTIPNTLDGMQVVSVASTTFYNQRDILKKVVISANITEIEASLFASCSLLESVTLPDTVKIIEMQAFYGCSSLRDIAIPENVIRIGNFAFGDCDKLENVTIPASVTAFGYAPFSDCDNLHDITISNDNEQYMYEAGVIYSKDKTVLVEVLPHNLSVSIPSEVKEIASYAFDGCVALSNITIPEGVEEIGYAAFSGCESLTSMYIPASVTWIGIASVPDNSIAVRQEWPTFNGCKSLKKIEVAKENEYYSSLDGVLYNKDATVLVSVPTKKMSIVIPDSVKEIATDAFFGCDSLNSVVMPVNVSKIGRYAFFGCSSLTSVTIPLNVSRIGAYTFFGCNSLTSVTMSSSITNIEDLAFSVCNNLKYLNFKGTEEQWSMIEFGMFWDEGLSDEMQIVYNYIEPTPHIHSFGEWIVTKAAAYQVAGEKKRTCSECGAEELETIAALTVCSHIFGEWIVTEEAAYQVVGEKTRTCSICGKEEKESIPALTEHNPHIYDEWKIISEPQCDKNGSKVRECTVCGVQEIDVIPETGFVKGGIFEKAGNRYKIQEIKGKRKVVLQGVVNLKQKKVKIPKTVKVNGKTYTVVEIGEAAFKNNTKITTVTIESTVTKIGKNAFNGCKKLKTVTIKGTGLTTISQYAFKNCVSLTAIIIPKNVRLIGKQAFYGCKRMKFIEIKTKKLTNKNVGKDAFKGIYTKVIVEIPKDKIKIYKKMLKAKGVGKKAKFK